MIRLLLLLVLVSASTVIDAPEMVPVTSMDQKLKQYFNNTIAYDNNAFPCDGKL